ncbi:proteasome subunit beta [Pseudonocardia broussonetiae]|uniref:Proteasome subunit beta n=1 Tax=Pseudonocardia broussonetiae TaxID=2736640 RepID=A0A6M6JKF1_9PSEU|nr:proteasome subunit beta [Pseudonocardia broussonetiae]QJY48634.1 proteasome subunit beta [Pseudonocardia broussonetiae]
MSFPDPGRRAPVGLDAYLAPGPSSFTDFVTAHAPHLLPSAVPAHGAPGALEVPHGTTIVALVFDGGVVIAGDRRATQGNVIAQRDIEKVFVTDAHSAVGIAGSAGIALEMVRLFTVELEHYEKIEGTTLSLDGKANKLAAMVRANLGAAMQGFVVVPLFAGYDIEAPDPSKAGRIVTYDATGGRYDELLGYHAVGSGSVFAKSALKKRHRVDADLPTTVRTAIEALYDAADDDSATGGPDLTRRLYPIVVSITGPEGAIRRPEAEIAEVVAQVVAGRTENPGG